MTADALLSSFRARGFVLSVEGGLAVRPASALTAADRVAIRAHLPELVAALSEPEPECPPCEPVEWPELAEANRLVRKAESLVADLGVDPRHPEVKRAAAMVQSALVTHDMETVRFATSEFAVTVRWVAGAHLRCGTRARGRSIGRTTNAEA